MAFSRRGGWLHLCAGTSLTFCLISGGAALKFPPEDQDAQLAALAGGPPPSVDHEKMVADAAAAREKELATFGNSLAVRPRGEPYQMFKSSCLSFVEDKAEKCGYNPDRLHYFLPACTWGPELCGFLLEKLKQVVASFYVGSAAGSGGSAPSPGSSASAAGSISAFIETSASKQPAAGAVGSLEAGSSPLLPVEMLAPQPPALSPAEAYCGQVFNLLQQRKMHQAIRDIVEDEMQAGSGSAPGSIGSGSQ
ncbi:unnamed protein product [Amoebophrya sp. A25]|nr:unnamed protein product [Amoebophrya sp. A25]|eukprot:GSA25T00010743001.1